MIKVLFCSLQYDYGNPQRGLCLEYKTLYDSLRRMENIQADFFAIDGNMLELGREGMNEKLIRVVEESRPDVLFCCLFTEEIKKETIHYITFKTKTKTFNWFGDDHWRVPIYSRHWAPHFTLVGTTDSKAIEQYHGYGIKNVLKTQWAANHFTYQPQDPAMDSGMYDITFFGQMYGKRGSYIQALKDAGLPAEGYGRGWPKGGGTSVEEMLNIYSFSKINLNFSETPYYGFKKNVNLFAKLFVKKELGRYKLDAHHFADNWKAMVGTRRKTIKARVFEVLACGGFLLTGKSDEDIRPYYEPGKEVVEFEGVEDLTDKCCYYIEHDAERKIIARAGYERTLREHTYVHRIREVFSRLELE